MRRGLLFAAAFVLCLLAMSCGYGSMYTSGTSSWDVGLRSGVQSHYYSYSGQ